MTLAQEEAPVPQITPAETYTCTYFSAMDEWVAYMNAVYVMFRTAGGGKADFDFKLVDTWANHTNRGADFQRYAMGGGEMAHATATAGTLACDTGRVYNATVRRRIVEED